MRLSIKNSNGEKAIYDIPQGYTMQDLYCELKNIGEEVSDEEVNRMMANSTETLTSQNGNYIRFCDYASSYTPLEELGLDENTEYHFDSSFSIHGPNG